MGAFYFALQMINYAFKLTDGTSEMVFCADTKGDYRNWMAFLRVSIRGACGAAERCCASERKKRARSREGAADS